MTRMEKPPLLFLCHRIPYPPNKGDKIRSFHLLRHLSQHFDIYLASFVDDPQDWPWVPEVEKYCRAACIRPLKPWLATLRSVKGLLGGEALSIPYYADKTLSQWVASVSSEHDIRHAIVYSSSMAQFMPAKEHKFQRKVIDFVDVDSDKWAQYAAQSRLPLRWIYQREARCLLGLEQVLAHDFDAGLFVSSSEAALFHKLSPETAHKVGFYNNGVNTDYFSPDLDEAAGTKSPFSPGCRPLVFTGAMDYWPNIDAVVWFANEVFPSLKNEYPKLKFYVVGSNPSKVVKQLASIDGVSVTGRVEDVRPYLKYCLASVAPMRIARGVQNKVLEGMAMARPVIVSRKGLEGIEASDPDEVLIAETLEDYRVRIAELFAGDHDQIGERARLRVQESFDWDANLPEVVFLLGREDAVPSYARTRRYG
jgi:sugar transferase (PEP-CTERM/EpsH1 system associated)